MQPRQPVGTDCGTIAIASGGSDDRDVVEVLAEEYVARRRRGEPVTIEEYVARCPERAKDIRALFPTIATMELHKPQPGPLAVNPPSPSASSALRELGDCRLIREIGRGGMGIVYEAEQKSLGRRVAVKVLPRGLDGDERSTERFLREARTAAKLHHPHIVPVHSIGQSEGQHYFVMQLIPGVGLDRVLRELRNQASGSLAQTASGLGTLRDDVRSVVQALLDGSIVKGLSETSDATVTQAAPSPGALGSD